MAPVAYKRAASRIRWQRDLAIAALIKARRHHRTSRHILGSLLECVHALREVES